MTPVNLKLYESPSRAGGLPTIKLRVLSLEGSWIPSVAELATIKIFEKH
jgi:hypothetical protein